MTGYISITWLTQLSSVIQIEVYIWFLTEDDVHNTRQKWGRILRAVYYVPMYLHLLFMLNSYK